jgi:hypothetical protein
MIGQGAYTITPLRSNQRSQLLHCIYILIHCSPKVLVKLEEGGDGTTQASLPIPPSESSS